MPALAEFAVDSPFFSRVSSGDTEGVRVRSHGPQRPENGGSNTVHVLAVGLATELQSHLRHRLSAPPWSMLEAGSGSEALSVLTRERVDMLLVASSLPDLDAGEFQQLVREQFPHVQILAMESISAPTRSVGASLLGELLDRHADAQRIEPVASVRPRFPSAPQSGWQGIVGGSPAMQRVFRTADMVAPRSTTVLIQGESGTGKDLLARAIHQASSRARQPFVVINCAAIPEALLESELFGHTKGAFTGASQTRLGRVHAAHGGTLFLDEIGDMPLPLQSKILRFLEQGEIQRVGGTDTLKVDCRIVAATNVDLQQQVRSKQFREDLFYRLSVLPIVVPPLRERMDDLPPLCASFLDRFSPGISLRAEAMDVLMQHNWPGNVRELRNVMERASLFAEGRHEIEPDDVML